MASSSFSSTKLVLLFAVSWLGDAQDDDLRASLVRALGDGVGTPTTLTRRTVTSAISSAAAGADGGDAIPRPEDVEAGLWSTFQALPKNAYGRLDLDRVGYAVQRYFASTSGRGAGTGRRLTSLLGSGGLALEGASHSQRVVGSGNDAGNRRFANQLSEAAAAAGRRSRGWSIGDVARVVSALERHLQHDAKASVLKAYAVHNISASRDLSTEEFGAVIGSFLRANILGASADAVAAALNDAALVIDYRRQHRRNPFVLRGQQWYSFQEVQLGAELAVASLAETGRQKCAVRRSLLEDLSEPGTGRVTLGDVYASAASGDFERPSVLRALGVVEEDGVAAAAVGSAPRLLIADYMLLPTSCPIHVGETYSVCCASECEGVVRALEMQLQAPVASPDRVLGVVAEIASSFSESPRSLPPQLGRQLARISEANGGDIPLHSDSFAEWLHYAFPGECPLRRHQPLQFSAAAYDADELAVGELRRAPVVPYTAGRMLADYAAGRGRRNSAEAAAAAVKMQVEAPTTATPAGAKAPMAKLLVLAISPGDACRFAVGCLLACTMLRASLAQWRTATAAKDALDGGDEKNPKM